MIPARDTQRAQPFVSASQTGSPALRVLIDWDWGSSGVWLITKHRVCSIPRDEASYSSSSGIVVRGVAR
jgi:hypothetical protein